MLTRKPLCCGRAFTLALIFGVALACGVPQDQFDCENATAHLKECCPGFDATAVYCSSSTSGCTTTFPAIDVPDSDCILGESCEDLISTAVCDRIAALGTSMPTSAVPSAPLCGPNAPAFVPCDGCDGGEAGGPSEPGTTFIACKASSDCADAEVCCFEENTTITTVCSLTPCGAAPQLCGKSSECAAGEVCQMENIVAGDVTLAGFCEDGGLPVPTDDAAPESADADDAGASDEETEGAPPVEASDHG